MNTIPQFDTSIVNGNQSKVNVALWKPVLDAYDNGNYKEAIVGLLKYTNEQLINTYGNNDQSEFAIPHGSAVVNISINEKELIIKAPFLKLPPDGSIALLRQVTQLNFHPLMLARIILDDHQLSYNFRCDLDLCEPYKIYDVLREICLNADQYDDTFITKFKAQPIREPNVTHYSADKLEIIWNKIQQYINEAENIINFFEQKRWNDLILDVYTIALFKIDYYCAPQGYLRNEIESAISFLYNKNTQYNDRLAKGRDFLHKLRTYDKKKLLDDIYLAEIFIPYKQRSDLEFVRSSLNRAHTTAKKEISSKDFVGATLTLQQAILWLFYYYYTESKIESLLTESLIKSGNQTWETAATVMWEAIDTIMNEEKYSKHQSQYV